MAIKEMQIKTTTRYHFSPTEGLKKMAIPSGEKYSEQVKYFRNCFTKYFTGTLINHLAVSYKVKHILTI